TALRQPRPRPARHDRAHRAAPRPGGRARPGPRPAQQRPPERPAHGEPRVPRRRGCRRLHRRRGPGVRRAARRAAVDPPRARRLGRDADRWWGPVMSNVRPFPARVVRPESAGRTVSAMTDSQDDSGVDLYSVAIDPAWYADSPDAVYVYRQS